MNRYAFAIILVLTCSYCNALNDTNTAASNTQNLTENDLHNLLFKNYNRNVMPRADRGTPICVSLEMFLLSVDDVDEKQQTIRIRAFLEMKWTDAFMTWDSNQYSGIDQISVKVNDIWIPDLTLIGSFGELGNLGHKNGDAVVDHTGLVTVWPYSSYEVACKMSIVQFPFDEQRCSFIFMSWTKTASALKLRNMSGKVNLGRYSESGEWKLTDGDMHYYSMEYDGDLYDRVSFDLCLRRKPLYYVMNVMIPVLSISLLNLFCFVLPSQDGERVTLSISIFLTLAVFLTIVNSTMPESSDEVSKFSVYVGLQLFGNALTIAVTTISLHLFHRNEKRKISKVYKFLLKITCTTLPEEKNDLFRLARNMTSMYDSSGNNKITSSATVVQNRLGNRCNGLQMPEESSKVTNTITAEQDEEKPNKVTWKMVSVAMDRFCLVGAISWHIVLIVTLIGSIAS